MSISHQFHTPGVLVETTTRLATISQHDLLVGDATSFQNQYCTVSTNIVTRYFRFYKRKIDKNTYLFGVFYNFPDFRTLLDSCAALFYTKYSIILDLSSDKMFYWSQARHFLTANTRKHDAVKGKCGSMCNRLKQLNFLSNVLYINELWMSLPAGSTVLFGFSAFVMNLSRPSNILGKLGFPSKWKQVNGIVFKHY